MPPAPAARPTPDPTTVVLTMPCPRCWQERKLSPLQRGGTLQGAAAAGKDASEKFKSMAEGAQSTGPVLQVRPSARCCILALGYGGCRGGAMQADGRYACSDRHPACT